MGGVDDREQLVNNDGNQMDDAIEFVNNSVSTLKLHLFLWSLHSGSCLWKTKSFLSKKKSM